MAAHLRIPYRLTSISVDLEHEARGLVHLLLLRLHEPNRPVTIRKIETELVVCGSARPPRNEGQ